MSSTSSSDFSLFLSSSSGLSPISRPPLPPRISPYSYPPLQDSLPYHPSLPLVHSFHPQTSSPRALHHPRYQNQNQTAPPPGWGILSALGSLPPCVSFCAG